MRKRLGTAEGFRRKRIIGRSTSRIAVPMCASRISATVVTSTSLGGRSRRWSLLGFDASVRLAELARGPSMMVAVMLIGR